MACFPQKSAIFADTDKLTRMNRTLSLLVTLVMATLAEAQHVPLRILSQTPVEATEETRSLLFDRHGLMWLGTDQGVRAYDGYRFYAYRSDAYTPGILPNNYVRALTEDAENRLWIGTRDGLVCYDRPKGTFRTYHLRSEQARLVNALFTASDGTVWVATDAGISRYDAEKDDFIDINMQVGPRAFAEDRRGNLYIGTWEGGLLRLDHATGKLVEYPRLNERNTVASLLMDSRGRLWIGTWEHGIIRMDTPHQETAPSIHRMNDGRRDFRTFHRLVEDSASHSVWGCCIEGLTRVDLDDDSQVENYPDLNFCYDMLADGHGNLWVATRNSGIVHLSTKPAPFRYYHLDPTGQVLPVNRIQSVFTTDGQTFWLGLQPYGLACYDRLSGRVSYNTQIPGMAQLTGPNGIHAQNISDLILRPDGQLWMASSHGILIWQQGQPVRLLPNYGPPFLSGSSAKAFHLLPGGSMLVGQGNGVGLALSETKGRMLTLTENGRDFSQCEVNAIMEDHQHRIWLATMNEGIICISGNILQPKAMKCRQYAPDNGNYPLDDAIDCYEDSRHRIWAVSGSGGLFLYNAASDRFEPVNHLYHIAMVSISAIEGDEEGRLWLSTDKGLLRLETADDRHTTAFYGMEDGIEAVRFSSNCSFRFGRELFFGSAGGFFSFEPQKTDHWRQTAQASLVVTGLFINDRPYQWLDTEARSEITAIHPFYTQKITIPSHVEKFSVEFSLLTYQNQQQCKYAYRLEGYDRKWHFTNADNRKATYQNLPAGTYQLRLRAIDSYGRKADLPYPIAVQVLPPWYLSWWAYLAYALLLAAAVYGAATWYRLRVRRRARLQQRVSELIHYRELMLMKQFEGAHKALEAEEQQHSSPDELFLQRAIDCVKQHLDDSEYDREQFAKDMCVSSSTLYNKLRALTGQSVTAFINSIRLKEACTIVRQRPDINVNELSMLVGFNTPKYFAKCFKREFDELPSEYIERIKAGKTVNP